MAEGRILDLWKVVWYVRLERRDAHANAIKKIKCRRIRQMAAK